MESESQTPFAQTTLQRLEGVGKDIEWLIKKMRERGNHLNRRQLHSLFMGEYESKPRMYAISVILYEEEERQRLKRKVGIKV